MNTKFRFTVSFKFTVKYKVHYQVCTPEARETVENDVTMTNTPDQTGDELEEIPADTDKEGWSNTRICSVAYFL